MQILCGGRGSGKTLAMAALTKGRTRIQPKRAIAIRFYGPPAVASGSIDDESSFLKSVQTDCLGIPANATMSADLFANFLCKAVTKDPNPTTSVFQNLGDTVKDT